MVEDFKDVMLSELPPHNRGVSQYGHNIHAVGAFENYKGILLCDRPSENRVTAGEPTQPFLPPGAVDDPCLGLQPSTEQLRKHDYARRTFHKKKQLNSAQVAHRKALKALGEDKMQERLDAVERQIEADNKKQAFRDAQQRMRVALRENGNGPEDVLHTLKPGADFHETLGVFKPAGGVSKEEDEEEEEAAPLPRIPSPPVSHVRTPSEHSNVSSKEGKKKKAKPKWAMTEEEAFDAEMRETDDLIKFARGLDFEKYLDDYEIREALSIMRERVDELKDEESVEQQKARTRAGVDLSGVYNEVGGDGHKNILVQQIGDIIRAMHENAKWSPAVGGKVRGREVVGMHFGDESVSGAVDDGGNIRWNNGIIWEKSEESYPVNIPRRPGPPSDISEVRRAKRKNQPLSGQEELERDWDNVSTYSALSERKRRLINDEAMALAEKILNTSNALRAVHSKQSLGRILEELTHKAYNDERLKTVLRKPMETTGAPISQPNIAVHEANAVTKQAPRVLTQLKKSNDYVQNLPYLYRCPSI